MLPMLPMSSKRPQWGPMFLPMFPVTRKRPDVWLRIRAARTSSTDRFVEHTVRSPFIAAVQSRTKPRTWHIAQACRRARWPFFGHALQFADRTLAVVHVRLLAVLMHVIALLEGLWSVNTCKCEMLTTYKFWKVSKSYESFEKICRPTFRGFSCQHFTLTIVNKHISAIRETVWGVAFTPTKQVMHRIEQCSVEGGLEAQ